MDDGNSCVYLRALPVDGSLRYVLHATSCYLPRFTFLLGPEQDGPIATMAFMGSRTGQSAVRRTVASAEDRVAAQFPGRGGRTRAALLSSRSGHTHIQDTSTHTHIYCTQVQ